MNNKLKVHSIFESISGEAGFFPQGTWCTFLRLQGCNCRCDYCDTPEAQSNVGGKLRSSEEVLSQIRQRHLLITGGEPLMQQEALMTLIAILIRTTHQLIQVETNGSICPPGLLTQPLRLGWVVDYKLLSSGMTEKMLPLKVFADILASSVNNCLKFVVATQKDLSQMISVCAELTSRYKSEGPFIISPIDAKGACIPDMTSQIKKEFPTLLPQIIFSVQLHKLVELP